MNDYKKDPEKIPESLQKPNEAINITNIPPMDKENLWNDMTDKFIPKVKQEQEKPNETDS